MEAPAPKPALDDTTVPPSRPPPWRKWAKRIALVIVLVPVLFIGGLAAGYQHTPLNPEYSGPKPLPESIAKVFTYSEQGTPVEIQAEFNHEEEEAFKTRWVHFTVTTPGEEEPHRVQVIQYRVKGEGRRPAVVISPITGGDYEISKMAAGYLAENGIHAAIVLRAESLVDMDVPETEERLERVLRTAVVDRRRAIDWLQSLPEVDSTRIGAFGVSLGGIATAILSPIEHRIQASMIVMAGGDLGDVIVRSVERECRQLVDHRLANGVSRDTTRERIRKAFAISDPLNLAPYLDARRVLLVTTRWDDSVPSDTQERLYEALGGPRRYHLPTGHYSAIVYLPLILRRMADFFAEMLGGLEKTK